MLQVRFPFCGRFSLFAVVSLVALLPAAIASQATAQESLGPEYLSSRACAVVVVRTGDILNAPETELWPREIMQAIALRDLKIDSEHIAEMMVQVETPAESAGGPPNPDLALVVRLTEAYDIDEVLPMLQNGLEEGEINGAPARFAPRDGQPSLYMPDEMTLIIGGGPMLRRIGRLQDPGTKLSEMFAATGGEDNATLVVDLEALRPMLLELREMAPPGQLPPPLAGLLDAPELLDGLILTANITGDCQCRLTMQATDEDAAEQMSQNISQALEFAGNMSLAEAHANMPEGDAVSEAWVAYAERMVPQVIESLQPAVQDEQLVLEYNLGPLERLAVRYGVVSAVGFLRAAVNSEGPVYSDEGMMYEEFPEEAFDEFEGEFEGEFDDFEQGATEEEEAFPFDE